MSNWVPLDSDKLSKPMKRSIRGVALNVFMSPHDVPEAVRGFYDEKKERFVVEFRYIGEEPTKMSPEKGHVALRTGKNSGRLYAIKIDVSALKAKAVALQVLVQESKDAIDAIDDLSKTTKKKSKEAIDDFLKAVEEAIGKLSKESKEAVLLPNHQAAIEAIEDKKEKIFADLVAT